ncbi:exocyst complex subunit sec6 [Vairimorpha ceranae]|nr:exocyst complex subunit sec6 [Vairimorpha ceranae]KAF5141588.1 hypothetical protein G9O61_00g001300 [Vairimorpha ceranae]KKO74632.1 exocyst complex subunit sec6 [Vairimorpha ceranae]
MIEEEEKIVFYLEELDTNFSKINRTLKEIEERIEKIYLLNSKVVSDYNPIIKIFKDHNSCIAEDVDSSLIMNGNLPKDPFIDSKIGTFEKDSSSTLNDPKIYSDSYIDESSSTEINEFDIEKIPEIFKKEEDFFKVYNFILSCKRVKFEDIVDTFNSADYNKICVYLEVLRNKKFIKKKGSVFYID